MGNGKESTNAERACPELFGIDRQQEGKQSQGH